MAAKAGVNALSNNLAIELGPQGVTSNVIAPGPIGDTEGMDRLTPAGDAENDARIPLGRKGSVKDIADATVYLFSDGANYVNGDVLIGTGSPSTIIVYLADLSYSGWGSVAYDGRSSRPYSPISRLPTL